MRAADLGAARVGVWGLGREGQAAIGLLRAQHPAIRLLLIDDNEQAVPPSQFSAGDDCAFGSAAISGALDHIDVLVKSPGVSLYRPEIQRAREKGVAITSLLNLWFAEKPASTTICVTGSKGKSTTASLIAHILKRLGRCTALAGNIGVPVTEIDRSKTEFAVIEVSSYQAADFDGCCDIGVLTSLFPEHLDWHRTLEAYYRDKLNLLHHARLAVANAEAGAARGFAQHLFNTADGFHTRNDDIFAGRRRVGPIRNPYLARPHNRSNLCAALSVAGLLGIDAEAALAASEDFRALPHRQQEIGEIDGVLYVDDSISTAPEAAIAALEVYRGRAITLLVGGYDRGVDYAELVTRLTAGAARTVICLGASGARIQSGLRAAGRTDAILALSMREAVDRARRATPEGGVVLLSPAAPSYGYFRDFAERGRAFAAEAGLGVEGGGIAQ